jgi:predicted RecA/RadA family phage recombinase
VVVEKALSSAETGTLVGARWEVLMEGAFGLEDQNAGMISMGAMMWVCLKSA